MKCAFGLTGKGWKGPDHCRRCHAEVNRACRAFDRAVFFGEFDWQWYTPAERKAMEKKKAA